MIEEERNGPPEQPEGGAGASEEQPATEPVQPAPEGERPAAEGAQPAAEGEAAEAAPRERPRRRRERGSESREEVIPGADLEPDLVLEERDEGDEFAEYAGAESEEGAEAVLEEEPVGEEEGEPAPVAHEPIDIAADARYAATGKRKSAVARVTLKPGSGVYTVNGRHLDQFFPRIRLQKMAKQPLEAAGYHSRMDVMARIHGGGVSSQAGALRHGIARALVEADPALRLELKRRGYLTRDPRVKERKKAGLKKARKRPQFSKR